MTNWIATLATLDAAGEAAVLVTVVEVRGSTPRESGCKMVVTEAAAHGTIGGGHLELKAIEIGRRMLGGEMAADGPLLREFLLGPSLAQCCGGAATLLFETVRPPALRVALFGAGHVGQALVKVLAELPCRITWIDSRGDAFPAEVPANTASLVSEAPEFEIDDLPADSYVLVMTHSHQTDLAIVEAALRRGRFRYIGLIGSRTKRARFTRRLAQRGIAPAVIDRLVCPIGVPDIGGKHPAAIAIATAAQVLQFATAATQETASPPNLHLLPTAASGRSP
jgi:xanthine dehydrogenase accessory factor